MFEHVEEAVATLRRAASAVRSAGLSADDARRLVALAADGERACQALRASGTQAALRTRAWFGLGHRTPAQWLAAVTGTSEGQAITAVQTAGRLRGLDATRRALIDGRISESQAAHITEAASLDPSAEQRLLTTAVSTTVRELRERCREVVAAADRDEAAAERIRRGRFCRQWIDPDGAVRLNARLAPDDGALLSASIEARARRLQDEAARSGHREPGEAYRADALVGLASGQPGPRAVVHVHVDAAALERGHAAPGEVSRIDGVGPVPVATARRLAMQGFVKALSSDDAEVTRVAHLGRTIPARLRTALEAEFPTCAVPTCEMSSALEIDHVVPLSRGGTTSLANLVRLCRYHHAMKTHRGWRLTGRRGALVWTPPGRIIRAGSMVAGPGRAPPASP